MNDIGPLSDIPFCVTSRRRAALVTLGGVACVAGGWLLTKGTGTTRTSVPIQHAIGWLTIMFAIPMSIAWLVSFFIPARLWIEHDGFSFETFWRKRTILRWNDIDRLWVLHQRGSSLVVWTNKRPASGITNTFFGCDGWLPPGWTLSAGEIEGELNVAKDRYEAAERTVC